MTEQKAPERIWAGKLQGGKARTWVTPDEGCPPGFWWAYVRADLHDALTAERDALAAEVKRLREALEPFSAMAGEMFAANWNDDSVAISFVTKDGPLRLTFFEFRRARAALEEGKDG